MSVCSKDAEIAVYSFQNINNINLVLENIIKYAGVFLFF